MQRPVRQSWIRSCVAECDNTACLFQAEAALFDAMANPDSVGEWLHLSWQHQQSALKLADDRLTAGQALQHVGFSTEAALKGYIFHRERFNSWPSRAARPDLYDHNLRNLCRIAQIDILALGPVTASWHTMLQWGRHQGYDPKPTPIPVVDGYLKAAFGEDGAVTWLCQNLP